MDTDGLDVGSVRDALIHFAGRGHTATSLQGLKCLVELRQVQDALPVGRELRDDANFDAWHDAVEQSIKDAASSLPTDVEYTLVNGRVDRVPVTVDQLCEATMLAFNLNHQAALGRVPQRQERALSALGLTCSITGYRDNPGPQRELMTILARQLLTLSADNPGIHTEFVEFTFYVEPTLTFPSLRTNIKLQAVDTTRTVRATADGACRLFDPLEIEDVRKFGDVFRPGSPGCSLKARRESDGSPYLVVGFPSLDRGEHCQVSYTYLLQDGRLPINFANEYLVRPVEPYDRLGINVRIYGSRRPSEVYGFEERGKSRRGERWHHATQLEAGDDLYRYVVDKPTPHIAYGFVVEF